MPAGRKPLPTNLKVVTGRNRPDRGSQDEPQPEVARVDPPAFLSEPALLEWSRVCEELFNLGILSNLDRAALAAYCTAYGRWVSAEEAIRLSAQEEGATDKSGLTIKTASGNIIQNPLVGAANRAMGDMIKFASEFGMTPAARSRISVEKAGRGGVKDKAGNGYF